MKDYESLTCLEIKKILKKHKITGYSKLCKQELVKLVKKTLNNKKGGILFSNYLTADNRNNEETYYNEQIKLRLQTLNKRHNIEMKTFTPTPEISNIHVATYISKRNDIPMKIKAKIVRLISEMRKLNSVNKEFNKLNTELGNIQTSLTDSGIENIEELNRIIDYLVNKIRLSK